MTPETARAIVAEMQAKPSNKARRRMLELALQYGNLSAGARAVYRAQLDKESQE